jgi:hypothetical protein
VHSDAFPLPPINLTVVIDRTARTATVWSGTTKHFYVQRFMVRPGPGPTPTPSPFPLFVGRSPFANLDVLDFRIRLTGHGSTAGIATTGLEYEGHFATKGSTKIAHVTATTQLADEYGAFPMAIELGFDSTGSTQTAKMSFAVDSLTRAVPDLASFRVPAGYTKGSSILTVIFNGTTTGTGWTSAPPMSTTSPSTTTSPNPSPALTIAPAPASPAPSPEVFGVGARHRARVARGDLGGALRTGQRGVRRVAAGFVDQHARRRVARSVARVAIAPLQQRDQHRIEVASFFGERVFEARRMLLIGTPLEDAGVREAFEPRGQDVGGDGERRLEVVEAALAQKHVAQDQQRPPVADDVERARDRALL